MVSILSFFTGKRKSRRAPSPPPNTTNALTPGTSGNGTSSPPRKSAGRFMSMRHKPTPGRPADISTRRASSDVARRKSAKKPSKEGLPKLALGWEGEAEGGDILGLQGVGRPPVLSEEEGAKLAEVRWSLEEVGKGWETFGQALRDTGLETAGIFMPRRLPADPQNTQLLLALFAISLNPDHASSFPSLTSHYVTPNSTTGSSVWAERFQAALKDTTSPADIAECLKTISRRRTSSSNSTSSASALTIGLYHSFFRAEQSANFPADSYDKLFASRIPADVKAYLENVFGVWASIAAHADHNGLTGGKLCRLLGWWIWGDETTGGEWKTLYDGWLGAGRRIEHLFFAWIRYQSTKQVLPTRLLQLVESYPFGQVPADAEFLPSPPSTIPRRTLRVVLVSQTPLSRSLTPTDLLQTARRADGVDDEVPIWTRIRPGSSAQPLKEWVDDESAAFLKSFADTEGLATNGEGRSSPAMTPLKDEEPIYRPFASTAAARHARKRSQSHGDIDLALKPDPLLLGPVIGSAEPSASNGANPSGGSSPSRLRPQASADALRSSPPKPSDTWDDFMSSGFGEGTKEKLELSPSIPKSDIRPSIPSRVISFGSDTTERPGESRRAEESKFTVAEEEIVEIDDPFLPFAQDGLLDQAVSSVWPKFALARLRQPTASASGDIEWVLVVPEYRPPARSPSPISPPIERSASPAESTASRSLGFFRRSSSFGPRRSLFGNKSTAKTSASAYPLPTLTESSFTKAVEAELPTAISATPTDYTITEMGEMVKIPTAAENTSKVDADPARDSSATDWTYRAEGRAHLIFTYTGTSSAFSRRVLRLRKPTYPLDAQEGVAAHWRETLLPKLLPAELLLTAKAVKLDQGWARTLLENAEKVRPESRKQESGDLLEALSGDVEGSIMDDTTAVGSGAETIFAVEIKPKWGFMPRADTVHPPEAAEIKSRYSRYILHRHFKREGQDDTYDPLDLFSTDQVRVQEALEGLWAIWSDTSGAKNNWRVYVDGQPIKPDQIDRIPGSPNSSLINRTAPFLLPALQSSDVLHKLRELQATLDPVDISTLAKRFADAHPGADLFDPSITTEPTIAELDAFVAKYQADPSAHESWTLREHLIAYALSAIFKDCSLFLTIPLSKTGDTWTMQPGAKVKIIDLDLKTVGSMKKWYDLDDAIWRHWYETHPSIETTTDDANTDNMSKRPGLLQFGHSGISAIDGSSARAIFAPSPAASGPSTPTRTSAAEDLHATPVANALSLSDALAISPGKRSLADGPDAPGDAVSLGDALAMTPSKPTFPREEKQSTLESLPEGNAIGVGEVDTATDDELDTRGLPPTTARSESPTEGIRAKRSFAPSPSPTPFRRELPDEADEATVPIAVLHKNDIAESGANPDHKAEGERGLADIEAPAAERDMSPGRVTQAAPAVLGLAGVGAATAAAAAMANANSEGDEPVPAESTSIPDTAPPPPIAVAMLRGDSDRGGSDAETSGTSTPFEEFSTPSADIPEPVLAAVGVTAPETLDAEVEYLDGADEDVVSESKEAEAGDSTFGPGTGVFNGAESVPNGDEATAVSHTPTSDPNETAPDSGAGEELAEAVPSATSLDAVPISTASTRASDVMSLIRAEEADPSPTAPETETNDKREESQPSPVVDDVTIEAPLHENPETLPEAPVDRAGIDTEPQAQSEETGGISRSDSQNPIDSSTYAPHRTTSALLPPQEDVEDVPRQDELRHADDIDSASAQRHGDGAALKSNEGSGSPALSAATMQQDVEESTPIRTSDEPDQPSRQVAATFVPLQDLSALSTPATEMSPRSLEAETPSHMPEIPLVDDIRDVTEKGNTADNAATPTSCPISEVLDPSQISDDSLSKSDVAENNANLTADSKLPASVARNGSDKSLSARDQAVSPTVATYLETQLPGPTPAEELPPMFEAPVSSNAPSTVSHQMPLLVSDPSIAASEGNSLATNGHVAEAGALDDRSIDVSSTGRVDEGAQRLYDTKVPEAEENEARMTAAAGDDIAEATAVNSEPSKYSQSSFETIRNRPVDRLPDDEHDVNGREESVSGKHQASSVSRGDQSASSQSIDLDDRNDTRPIPEVSTREDAQVLLQDDTRAQEGRGGPFGQ